MIRGRGTGTIEDRRAAGSRNVIAAPAAVSTSESTMPNASVKPWRVVPGTRKRTLVRFEPTGENSFWPE